MNNPRNPEEWKVFCPTCGDVTNGHPEEDKTIKAVLDNGFSAENYIPTDFEVKILHKVKDDLKKGRMI